MKKKCGNCGVEEGPKAGLFWSRLWGLACKKCKWCIECGKLADAPREQQSADYAICLSCLKKGWITDPEKIRKAILADPVLGKLVEHQSPIQPEDLS